MWSFWCSLPDAPYLLAPNETACVCPWRAVSVCEAVDHPGQALMPLGSCSGANLTR